MVRKYILLKILEWISKGLALSIDLLRIKPTPKAILESFPDFDDQIFAIALTISKKKIPIVVLSNHVKTVPKHWIDENMNIKLVKKKSFQAFYLSRICKYIFFTHGSFLFKNTSKKQIVVNLWHGIPLKKIGYSIGIKMPKSKYIVATSNEMAFLIKGTYSPHEVVPTVLPYGLPRTDLLEPKTFNKSIDRKLIWMPTYRKSSIGEIHKDGFIDELGIGLNIESLRKFDSGLSKIGIRVELLLHPMADAMISNCFDSIEISKFNRMDGSLYRYLNYFDGLITDYSSVSIDYLITQKPIYLFAPDYNDYLNTRGLNGDLELLLGLPVNKSTEELLSSLNNSEDLSEKLEAAFDKWYEYKGRDRSNLIWNAIN
jgi:CDP-glycerol glycerophosphotransferase (TagB/SpsB family)